MQALRITQSNSCHIGGLEHAHNLLVPCRVLSARAHCEPTGMIRAILVADLVYQLDRLTVLGPVSLVAIGACSWIVLSALGRWVKRANSESKS